MKYLQNRKARLAASVAGVVLAFGVASPAFAQDAIADDGSFASTDLDARFYDASQFQVADVRQVNTGDVTATADGDSTADASIDQSLYVDQYQLNGGFDDGYYGDPYDDTGFFDDGDDDADGVLDEYDYVILFGDYDNDGFVDYWE